MKIILASQSLFRAKSLDILGLSYEKIPSDFDEKANRTVDPLKRARELAESKAKTIAALHPDALVIGADLFIVMDGKNMEKPADNEEAKRMLHALSGRTFDIISGLAVVKGNTVKSTVEVCKVRFREMNEYEINDYVSRYQVTKFAAAFDGDGMLRFAEHVEGVYNFQTGLPVNKLIELLREFHVRV